MAPTMMATRYTLTATAMKTWNPTVYFLEIAKFTENSRHTIFRKQVCGRHGCGRHGHCLWSSWFVAVIVKSCCYYTSTKLHSCVTRGNKMPRAVSWQQNGYMLNPQPTQTTKLLSSVCSSQLHAVYSKCLSLQQSAVSITCTYFSNIFIVAIWNLQKACYELSLLLHQSMHAFIRLKQLVYNKQINEENVNLAANSVENYCQS